jgi:hypothetical protein
MRVSSPVDIAKNLALWTNERIFLWANPKFVEDEPRKENPNKPIITPIIAKTTKSSSKLKPFVALVIFLEIITAVLD